MHQPIAVIKKPCLENLNAMERNETGRFCGTCQTTVIDFTAMSTDEISAYFMNHKTEHLCGTFISAHVKTDNKLDNFIAYLHSGKLKFLAVLLIGILILSGCRTRKPTTSYQTTGRILDHNTQTIEHLK